MTTGQKILECRKRARLTQEELAEKLGVTRQAVSRWEQDVTFPETESVLKMCKLFHVSADALLFGAEGGPADEARSGDASPSEEPHAETAAEPTAAPAAAEDGWGKTWGVIDHGRSFRFEYISKRRVFGMPLVHINLGACRAHGFFSIGIFSAGIFSLGIFSMGVVSAGVFALGLLAFGSFALGGLAFAGVALGLFAFGGVAVGLAAFGGLAVGQIAIGGAAVGQFAVGDWAHGWLAVGVSRASGTHTFLLTDGLEALSAFLDENVAPWLGSVVRTAATILRG